MSKRSTACWRLDPKAELTCSLSSPSNSHKEFCPYLLANSPYWIGQTHVDRKPHLTAAGVSPQVGNSVTVEASSFNKSQQLSTNGPPVCNSSITNRKISPKSKTRLAHKSLCKSLQHKDLSLAKNEAAT